MRGAHYLTYTLLIAAIDAAPYSSRLSRRKEVEAGGRTFDLPWADGLSASDSAATFDTGKNDLQRAGSVTNPQPSTQSSPVPVAQQVTTQQETNTGITDSTVVPTDNTTVASNGSGCRPGLKSVCFNSGYNVGMFDTIGAADSWISFGPLPSGRGSDKAMKAQVPMMAFARDRDTTIQLIKDTKPDWLLTWNEPDYSYKQITPTMEPEEAATQIQPLLDFVKGTNTKLVAPGLANWNTDWLPRFYKACGCQDRFTAYNMHLYTPKSADAITAIKDFRGTYGDKPLWITELAPGSGTCDLSADGVGTFMQDVYGWANKPENKWLERIYWNTGNEIGSDDKNVCQSFLLNTGGQPAPLLSTFKTLTCGAVAAAGTVQTS